MNFTQMCKYEEYNYHNQEINIDTILLSKPSIGPPMSIFWSGVQSGITLHLIIMSPY